MDLNEIRETIDRIDSEILALLNNRMELGLMAKKLKSQIEDRERENELLARLKAHIPGLIHTEFIEKIYTEIIKESKGLQRRDDELIAFQGEHGAYAEVASGEWRSHLIAVPFAEYGDVFEGVESGLCDYGIVPVENTLGGSVEQVNRLLIDTPLYVVGAVELPIHLCLLALPGTNYREIRTVYSHPQALAQARGFLARNNLEPLHYSNTAGAAKMVAEQRPKGSAAIASRHCAELYKLDIVKEDIEDRDRNMTRFLVLSREENKEQGNKGSITFSTEHKTGTLFRVLEVFAREDINLTRIESIAREPGNYAFFLDLLGSGKEDKVVKALEKVKEITATFRIMGFYHERKPV
jgi:prephenate dehydratase/chorismate mutase/prephenate dehydratase